MPRSVSPMLATLVEAPFDRTGWLFEIKWDGYRAIAQVAKGKATLTSRNDQDFTKTYSPIVKTLEKMRKPAVLDGEVVVLDEQGRSSFQRLQQYPHTGKGPLAYAVFDVLSYDGKDVRDLPLNERKQLLKKILPKSKALIYSDHVEGDGKAFFEEAKKQGLEGIMAKDASSPYHEGVRGREWLKIKTHARQEVVIGGFTEPRGSRNGFGALLVGVYEGKTLRYAGHVGTGFDEALLRTLTVRLKKLVTPRSPFGTAVTPNAPAHWVKPVLVCEVEFRGWTDDGSMRQPAFVGLREDKGAKDVVREREVKTDLRKPAKAPEPGELTHLDKPYWPKEGITKGDLIAYYQAVVPVILKHLKDRPMSLHRQPHGAPDEGFFQKDVSTLHLPRGVATTIVHSESLDKDIKTLVCRNEQTLLYMVNLGCIEINPWNARAKSLKHPDYLVFDLDPESVSFTKVVEVAQALHKILDRFGVPNVCKTSGSRGLHVYVPLGAKYTHEMARGFGELIATFLESEMPGVISLERAPAKRKGKVYIDLPQNKIGATNVVVYSARPKPGATVSTPLRWEEVTAKLDPSRFTIKTVPKRIKQYGDLFAPVLGKGIDLKKVLKRMETYALR